MAPSIFSALFNSTPKVLEHTSDFFRIHLCCPFGCNLFQGLDTVRLFSLNDAVHFSPEPEVQCAETCGRIHEVAHLRTILRNIKIYYILKNKRISEHMFP